MCFTYQCYDDTNPTLHTSFPRLRLKFMKVLWHRHVVEEATWEAEDVMRNPYPNLFTGKIFGDEIP
ncbi:Chromo domain-containing protein [Gossypium australe]|uniref:Chromo domain-containing protein n=1 Tax=Gossypium australe TaxID=47621 RepID=A0A5B6W726_9ROSI|nr:Chromo domain-containing protein [Gossypium australe]